MDAQHIGTISNRQLKLNVKGDWIVDITRRVIESEIRIFGVRVRIVGCKQIEREVE